MSTDLCQSAIAAHAPLKEYVEYVLKTPPEDVIANPAKFTPQAFAKTLPLPANTGPPPESEENS